MKGRGFSGRNQEGVGGTGLGPAMHIVSNILVTYMDVALIVL